MKWGPQLVAEGTRFTLWAPDAEAVTIELAPPHSPSMPSEVSSPVASTKPLDVAPRDHDDSAPFVPSDVEAWVPQDTSRHLSRDEVATVPTSLQTPMHPTGDGWWAATLPVPPDTRYRFRIGDTVVPDPASRVQTHGVHGWSVVVDHDHDWQADAWRGRPWHEMVILECHAGGMGGFAGIRRKLAEIAATGITAIELMPIGAFGGTRGWGYDGVLPYAVHEEYGTPAALKALVDTAHGLGLAVFLDVVYNHFGPDGNYLSAYAADFFDAGKHTPWGGAVAVARAPVARFFVDNALMWLRDYRIDGLRFDAVHAIGDAAFLDAMAAEIRAAIEDENPGRHVHLVLENEENDAARLTAYDAQWNDDFHNVLHVLLTGEQHSYYADFANDPAARLARCLAEGFVYQGEGSPNQDGKPRGTPSAHLPPTAFVTFLQNHDQIGNRALGERLTALADPAKLRAATALLLLCPQIPLLFMGDGEGSETPFLFFTDFHDDLADAVREGRRREFAKFPAFADEDARAQIPDPNAHDTFHASRPVPGPDAAGWRTLYRDLLALRHARIIPHLAGAQAIGAESIGTAAVTARWRLGDGTTLGIVLDLSDAPALPALPSPDAETLFVEGDRFLAWIAR